MKLARNGPVRSVLACAAALVLVSSVAACGSSDDSSSTATSDIGKPLDDAAASKAVLDRLGPIDLATGDTTRGVDGKVITIGGVADVRNQEGIENFPGVCDGARARFERANRDGGVNGYTFRYVGCTDAASDVTRTREAVQEMVEDREVFGLVPFTATTSNSRDYLNKAHVPYFGWGISPDYCGWNESQFAFSITGSLGCENVLPGSIAYSSVGLESYLAASGKKAGDVQAALVGVSQSASEVSISSLRGVGLGLGMKVPYAKAPLPGPGAPPLADYTPIASEIISSGANLVALTTPPATLFPVVAALRAGGYSGDILIFFSDERLTAVADQLDGVYAMSSNFGSSVFPSDTFRAVAADLKAVGSSASAGSSGTLTSYYSADLFLSAFAELGDKPVTTEALAGVLNSGFEYSQVGNAMCGSTWPEYRVLASNCAAVLRFDGEKKTLEPLRDLAVFGREYLFSVPKN